MDKLELSFITINIWGIFVSLGFALAIILALELAKRENIESRHIWNIAIISIICGIAGSRLLYAVENWREFSAAPYLIFDLINKTGLSFFGGFILAIIGIYIYARLYVFDSEAQTRRGLSTLRTFDLISLPLLAGMAVGRAGCFMAHDHLPLGQSAWLDPALYLMLANFALFLIFLMFRDRIKKQGVLTALFLIGISVSRFFTDYLRDESKYLRLTTGQWWAAGLFLTAAIILKMQIAKIKNKNVM